METNYDFFCWKSCISMEFGIKKSCFSYRASYSHQYFYAYNHRVLSLLRNLTCDSSCTTLSVGVGSQDVFLYRYTKM